MMLELRSIDPTYAEVVPDSWKTMIATTAKHDKAKPFSNLDDYVNYRIIDTGAPFVDTLMRFGMGILLTEEEIETVAPIVKPCYAALGLANDYFSFDVEWKEFQERQSDEGAMTNAAWLFKQWNSVPGNIAWSLRCPQYHPELCDEAGCLLEDEAGATGYGGPADYIRSLPSRGVRKAFVDAMNVWLVLPNDVVNRVKSIAETLHNASLMSDDIEDSSPLRPGQPAAHTIFGQGQTTNSANYLLIQAMDQIRDDYKNLTKDYATLKGFCEDLDEGKYSFPLVHALTTQPRNVQLRGILRESQNTKGMSLPLKQCVLEQLNQAGSMEYTHSILGKLMKNITVEIGPLEQKMGCSN
ncbi:hypothetical protein AARAC_008537 [Aspergillus arachidicola]|uniref:Isoprenoid synthase domain-containing protein n=1 Tax=Aspergillus arachidicola TaxID=656916 RepID=A0A2G7FFA1_9EURO|nr:hypothetical protein AARAC_008537 [Aspergillus arachidicola]